MCRNDSESISCSPVPRAVLPESLPVMAMEVSPLQTPLGKILGGTKREDSGDAGDRIERLDVSEAPRF